MKGKMSVARGRERVCRCGGVTARDEDELVEEEGVMEVRDETDGLAESCCRDGLQGAADVHLDGLEGGFVHENGVLVDEVEDEAGRGWEECRDGNDGVCAPVDRSHAEEGGKRAAIIL